jgi:hypothetical protein
VVYDAGEQFSAPGPGCLKMGGARSMTCATLLGKAYPKNRCSLLPAEACHARKQDISPLRKQI